MFPRAFLVFSVALVAACHPTAQSATLGDDKRPAPPVIAAKPVTIDVPISKDDKAKVRDVFAQPKPRSVALQLRGVKVSDDWNPKTTVHIFVNHPSADAKTSSDEPGFVFAFYLSPELSEPDEVRDLAFDLAPALARLREQKKWQPGDPISVTFVAVPPGDAALPDGPKVSFEKVALSLPKR